MGRTYTYPVRDVLVLTPAQRRSQILTAVGLADTEGVHSPDGTVKVHRVDRLGREIRYRLLLAHSSEHARRLIRERYFNVLVIDEGRRMTDGAELPRPREPVSVAFLSDLTPTHVADIPWRSERTLVLVEEGRDLSQTLFEVGKRQVGGFTTWPLTQASFFDAVDDICERRLTVGKTALCLAGGGIEGLIYEVGVLRALDELFVNRGVNDFDIYCGISAGAIAGCFLANGVPPSELVRSFQGDSSLIGHVKHRTIFDPAYGELLGRLTHLASGWFVSPRRALGGLSSFFMKMIPSGFFGGEKMRDFIRHELERPGRTDRFSTLGKELYIGATDQDTSEHVIFGDSGWDDVRISDAVRASTALVPFYTPAWLRGRWFVDGSFTRTSELDVAVEKGATLVVIVDPLVPIRSGVSGYVRRKGGLFAGLQGVKALVHTRFAEGLRRALERYPNVDFLVVVPEEDDMRLMSGSPMRYNYRVELEALAYQQTLLRIEESYAQFAGELARHGFEIRRPAEVLAASGRSHGTQPT
jgi:predicted acylesterase/phospholipase RssA